jgi:(2Fe-2S) ferredoxin
MRREELASWLEEVARQVRTGTLMIDGEKVAVPQELAARLKNKSKKGHERLRLDLEWQRAPSKKPKKDKNSSSAPVGNGSAEAYEANGGSNGSGTENKGRDGGSGEKVREYDAHVLVCSGGDCSKKGGKDLKKALKSELRAEGLNRDVRVDSVGCLGLCKHGPNAVVYPEGTWYLGLKDKAVPEVVRGHLKDGEPVERLAAERRSRQQAKK